MNFAYPVPRAQAPGLPRPEKSPVLREANERDRGRGRRALSPTSKRSRAGRGTTSLLSRLPGPRLRNATIAITRSPSMTSLLSVRRGHRPNDCFRSEGGRTLPPPPGPRAASAIALASRLRQRQPRNAQNWGRLACAYGRARRTVVEPRSPGSGPSFSARPVSARGLLGVSGRGGEQEACNKPCNKIGKFSLIQPHSKSQTSCKTTFT